MKIEDLYKCELYDVPKAALTNLNIILPKLQQLESYYISSGGRPFIVTNGYRSWTQHKAIYQAINDKRLIVGQNPLPIPLHSAHLSGSAADILDSDQLLKTWAGQNTKYLEQLGLWCESLSSTPTWLHAQIYPPKSGKRFFQP